MNNAAESMNIKKTKNIAYSILLISGLYLLSVIGWVITENRKIITVMELLTVWAAIEIVLLMAELYRASCERRKSHSLIALIFTLCMAVVTISNHFMFLTVASQIFHSNNMPSWLLLDGWPSITKGLECVAWGFFLGMAMLFASFALNDLGSKVITWTMRISGIMTLAGLIGPITGYMNYYYLSTVGYTIGFLVLSIEMIVYFNNKNRQLASNE